MKHGEPLANYDPSSEQTAAMSARIVKFSLETHADFSLLTPHGRRLQKRLRHRSWLLQEDGPYLPVEVPGPASWEDGVLLARGQRQHTVFSRGLLHQLPGHRQGVSRGMALVRCSGGQVQSRTLPTSCSCSFRQRGRPPQWSEMCIAASAHERHWSREVRHSVVGFLVRGHSEAPVQRFGENPQPTKKTKPRISKPKEGQEGLLHHLGRWHVSVFPVSGRSSFCVHDLPPASPDTSAHQKRLTVIALCSEESRFEVSRRCRRQRLNVSSEPKVKHASMSQTRTTSSKTFKPFFSRYSEATMGSPPQLLRSVLGNQGPVCLRPDLGQCQHSCR